MRNVKRYEDYIKAFTILKKCAPSAEHVLIAEHDIIYLTCPVERLSDAERKELEALGVFYDSDLDSFYVMT